MASKIIETLKEDWAKSKTIIIIFILILLNLFLFKIFYTTYKTKNDLKALIVLKDQQIKTYKDQNGNLHSQIQSSQGSAEAITAIYSKTIDSIAKIIGVKDKQISEYVEIVKQTKGQFSAPVTTTIKTDTIKIKDSAGDFEFAVINDTSYQTSYIDKWLTFSGTYYPSSSEFVGNYSIIDSLSLTTFYKQKGFLGLGKKQWFIDVGSNNPNTQILNLHQFQIIDDVPKRIGIGPSFTLTYYGGGFHVVPGISFHYSIIRF